MTKPLSIFNAQKSTSSQILCCVLERFIHIRNPTKLGRKGLDGSRLKKATETDGINGGPTEFEWNIFPGFTTLQLCGKVTDLLSDLGQTPELSQEEFSLCRCSMTSLVTGKAIKKNVWQTPVSSKYLQRRLVLDSGHLFVQVLKRSGILGKRIAHKEFGIILRTRCCWNIAERGCPIFRATTPLSRDYHKSKGHGKLSIHFAADHQTIETFSNNCFCQSAQSLRSSCKHE